MIKVNEYIIGQETYPNKETVYKAMNGKDFEEVNIDFQYEDDRDVTKLIITKKYMEDIFPYVKVNLIMKYIPYSRMDRYIEGYMFSLKYFCQLINDLNFARVFVLDPHSAVSTALLKRVQEISIQKYIDEIFEREKIDCVFYPDNGASKKYPEKLKLPQGMTYFYGHKKRNLQTGYIEEYDLVDIPDLKGKNVLIIDDICTRGMTFYLGAQAIKKHGAEKIYLYVSHLEPSVKEGKLLTTDMINKIYTSDSICEKGNEEKIEII